MKPNFQPKDIEKTIIELTKKGLEIWFHNCCFY